MLYISGDKGGDNNEDKSGDNSGTLNSFTLFYYFQKKYSNNVILFLRYALHDFLFNFCFYSIFVFIQFLFCLKFFSFCLRLIEIDAQNIPFFHCSFVSNEKYHI